MRPMTHEEAQAVMSKWEGMLAHDSLVAHSLPFEDGTVEWLLNPDRPDPTEVYTIAVGFDSDGPVILMKNRRQGNVLQWLL